MLRFLGIRRLAVIDQLDVEFEPGLNILTGETGAGKSVLVGAIDLLLGGRASTDLVRTGEDTATVQAVFERADGREQIVRREISSQGRSRAFIDDALATAAALKDMGHGLLELHGQHEHQTLLNPAEHLVHLDAFMDRNDLIGGLEAAFDAWRAAYSALDRSRLDDREKRARIDMASFQLDEINKTAPVAGEDDHLEAERAVLANADRLARLSNEAFATLYDGDDAALVRLAGVWKRVTELATIDPRFNPYVADRDTIKSSLDDLAIFLRSYIADLEASPERLEVVEGRLALLERIKRKYGPTLDDVLQRREDLTGELVALGASEERAAALAIAERETRDAFCARASVLSSERRRAAEGLARQLEAALAELAMPSSRVIVRVESSDRPETWTRRGIDAAEFLLSSNPGEDPRPLARIASGGELSRVMLALRTIVEREEGERTLVFDEVDAGIGGSAADAVGLRLQRLGDRQQVLCITHLPQIAARKATHFHVSKEVHGGRTTTRVTRLDAGGRELEIARMIAGAEVTPQVLASARELIAKRTAGETTAKAKTPSVAPQAKAKGRARGA
jgi:DNA repair protein RecN (Recombination protein N)